MAVLNLSVATVSAMAAEYVSSPQAIAAFCAGVASIAPLGDAVETLLMDLSAKSRHQEIFLVLPACCFSAVRGHVYEQVFGTYRLDSFRLRISLKYPMDIPLYHAGSTLQTETGNDCMGHCYSQSFQHPRSFGTKTLGASC